MPRSTSGRLVRQRVFGYQRKSDGSPDTTPFTLIPVSTGLQSATLVTQTPVQVVPNTLGYFEVELVPGDYECQLRQDSLTLSLPADGRAYRLTDLVKRS